ncbi:MAG: hypothetical protein IJ412_09710 [Oscillospiraceae bacterium]|nr:hypothetical protein [Oscillospiraceae bacterium]
MMTFRRAAGAVSAVACVLAGLVRLLALLSGTEPAEGFLPGGSLLIHYLILALPPVLAAAVSFAIPANAVHRQGGSSGIYAFCGLLFSSAVCICRFALGDASLWELAAAVLMALGSLWFAAWVMRKEDPSFLGGLLPVASWLVICLILFATRTASVHHVTFIIELLSSLAMLLFLCGMLRSVYAAGAPRTSRTLFFRGMLAFYFGFCLLLPQELWQMKQGVSAFFLPGKGVAAALLGITGLVCALQCMGREGDEPLTEVDPAALFEAASRQLEEDAAEDAAGRWGTAASALYGTPVKKAANISTAGSASETAISEPPAPAPTVSVPAERMNGGPVVSADAEPQPRAAEPEKAPATAVPVVNVPPVTQKPQPIPVPVIRERPAAEPEKAPAGTMERLDSLLDRIGTDAGRDTVDDVLADLNLLADKKPAAPAGQSETADGEKWVFRR